MPRFILTDRHFDARMTEDLKMMEDLS